MKGAEFYPFHKANIHERRFIATVCRAFPMFFLIFWGGLIALGIFKYHVLLLWLCAFMNVFSWLWISLTALLGIAGSILFTRRQLEAHRLQDGKPPVAPIRNADLEGECVDKVVHMIVLPNFKEDEEMLAETLQSLSEADDSNSFCIVLAMEAREGEGAVQKSDRLKDRFQSLFGCVIATHHRDDLEEVHMDSSVDNEVPGKASNLKWAVTHAFIQLQKQGFLTSLSSVVLTIADSDCLFHPGYFSYVSKEFNAMREDPGTPHLWTMWQAPQLPYRNYWQVPVCSRAWGYAAAMYEFGGVSSLSFGGRHMVFSAYSLPLQLAIHAEAWDGDVIAEDHHCFLKCFFYAMRVSAMNKLNMGEYPTGSQPSVSPMLRMRPVYLPVKSTSVLSTKGYWWTWVERWHQARRHAQGVAELSYALLAAWDALFTLPWQAWSFSWFYRIGQVVLRLWCIHLLPICQATGLGALTILWLARGRNVPMCPTEIWWADLTTGEYLLCGLAGAWVLVWPVVIPMLLVTIANYLFLTIVFMRDREDDQEDNAQRPKESIWHRQDAGIPKIGGLYNTVAAGMVFLDCFCWVSILMVPYGFVVEVLAYIEVAIRGNRFQYVTASKAVVAKAGLAQYGAFGRADGPPIIQQAGGDEDTSTLPASTRADDDSSNLSPSRSDDDSAENAPGGTSSFSPAV